MVKQGGDVEPKKISKSLGNVVDPMELADVYGPDAVRYFLLRDTSFGLDGEFSFQALHGRINADLANDLGNLLARSVTMVHKFAGGAVPPGPGTDGPVRQEAATLFERVSKAFEEYRLHAAIEEIWKLVRAMNRHVDTEKPWELAKAGQTERLNAVLYDLMEGQRIASHMLEPFIPAAAAEIRNRIGAGEEQGKLSELAEWGRLKEGTPVQKGPVLFPKIEEK